MNSTKQIIGNQITKVIFDPFDEVLVIQKEQGISARLMACKVLKKNRHKDQVLNLIKNIRHPLKNLSASQCRESLNGPSDNDKSWVLKMTVSFDVLNQTILSQLEEGSKWKLNFSGLKLQTEVKNGNYVKEENPKTDKPYPEGNWARNLIAWFKRTE